MAIDLNYVNSALTRTGNGSITQFNDGSAPSNVAGKNYDNLVKTSLTSHPWRWATKTRILTALTGDPDPPWLKGYQIPNDLLFLRVVTVDGRPIDYEQQFNKILCMYDTSVEVIAKYTWNVPETYWPGDFGEAITQALEAIFLRGIGERYQEAEARGKDAARALQAAKTNDAKRASPHDPFVSGTLAARSGAIAMPPLPWR